MPFFKKIYEAFKTANWNQILSFVQKYSAYVPVVLVPWIFSPISTDPFYIEKIVSIIFFSATSITAGLLKYLISKEKSTFKVFTSKWLLYYLCFLIFAVINQMFSINFNESFWGVGTVLFLGLFVWLVAVSQVYDKKFLTNSLLIGISIVSLIDLLVIITRFVGAGFWEIVKPGFSPNLDIVSLLLLLFVAIYYSLKSTFTEKFRAIYIIGLFVNISCFIIYAYLGHLFIVAYIAFALLIFSYFTKNVNWDNVFTRVRKILHIKENSKKEKQSKKNKKDYKKKIQIEESVKSQDDMVALKALIVVAAVIIGVFELVFQNSILIPRRDVLPLNTSWATSVNAVTGDAKNFIVGVGSNNYLYTYLHYKPQDVNRTQYWSLSYYSSLAGGFEILSAYGLGLWLLIVTAFVIRYVTKKENLGKNLWLMYKKQLLMDKIFILSLFFLIILTPLSVVSVWVLFVMAAKKFEPVESVISLQNSIQNNKKDLTRYFISSIVLVFILPSFALSYYLYWSSTNIFLGRERGDLSQIEKGLASFPYYPKSFDVAANSINKITDPVSQNNYVTRVKEYGRLAGQLNINDPYSLEIFAKALTTIYPDSNSYNTAVDVYLRLLQIGPNHIPYFLNLADVLVQVNNYSYAGQVLDKALLQMPQLDLAVVKRANVYLQAKDFANAKVLAERVKNTSQNPDVISAANDILLKITN